jgi:hypothetical protein
MFCQKISILLLDSCCSLSRKAKGKVMSIGLRIVIPLVFAYSGWQTASVEFGEMLVCQQQEEFQIPID